VRFFLPRNSGSRGGSNERQRPDAKRRHTSSGSRDGGGGDRNRRCGTNSPPRPNSAAAAASVTVAEQILIPNSICGVLTGNRGQAVQELTQNYQAGLRIRIRIRRDPHYFELLDPDRDPGGQECLTKIEKSTEFSCFEVLDVFF
jgi:hypothetical protein